MNKLEIDRVGLLQEVRSLIIQAVNLHHVDPESIQPETPLGPDGLKLDSVDILEIVVAVEQRFSVKVKDGEVGRRYFGNIAGITDFVMEQRP